MQRSSGSAACVVALLLLVIIAPVLYVASVGPVAWFNYRGIIAAEFYPAIETFYSPLDWVAARCPPADVGIQWYISLFRVPQPEPIVY